MTDAGPRTGPRTGRPGFVITRERLASGEHLAALRARATPDFPIRSDAELEASLDAALDGHDPAQDVWVFGYGSAPSAAITAASACGCRAGAARRIAPA